MSRFIDRLNQISQISPQPMGFRTTQSSSPKPKIQLVASLAQESIDNLADYVAGADAGLLRIPKSGSGAKTMQEITQATSDIPWGGWLENDGQEEMKLILASGCDFVVFPAASTPLAILQNTEVGKILELGSSLSEGLLRATNELPVDAVLIAGEQGEGYSLTWHHLMLFRRFADLLAKPLLVPAPLNVTAGELQALWKAGVKSVVVEVTSKQSINKLQELRLAINKTDFPLLRKREKIEALLPRIGEAKSETTSEEEEEEEE